MPHSIELWTSARKQSMHVCLDKPSAIVVLHLLNLGQKICGGTPSMPPVEPHLASSAAAGGRLVSRSDAVPDAVWQAAFW